MSGQLEIVHWEQAWVVVNKPAGLRSVPARGSDVDPEKLDSVQERIRNIFPEADGPVICHRLDQDTSGLMVAALTRKAHRSLSKQFMDRKVGKSYIGVLDGVVEEKEGSIDLPLIVNWPKRPRQMVDFHNGKSARTLYRVKDRTSEQTRVELLPITGRSHQLRVHAATPRSCEIVDCGGAHRCAWPVRGGLGCPIAGDSLYGHATTASRLLLHAETLAFWEPGTGEWKKFVSPAPF